MTLLCFCNVGGRVLLSGVQVGLAWRLSRIGSLVLLMIIERPDLVFRGAVL